MTDFLEKYPELGNAVRLYIELKRSEPDTHESWTALRDQINRIADARNSTHAEVKALVWYYGRKEWQKQNGPLRQRR